jgi:hypothetical protein
MDQYRSFRWHGRLAGFLGIVFFLSFMFADGFQTLKNAPGTFDLTYVITVSVFALAAYVVGWQLENIGGLLLILAGVFLAYYVGFSKVFGGWGDMLLFSLPFLIPGIFYLIAWNIKRKAKKNDNKTS